MKTTIYARYSTDKQSESSIDDQLRVCQARAKKEGLSLASIHTDNAVSGSTNVSSRPGGAALLADALAGRFEVLLLEGLDRLSRDQVEQERIVRRLEHRGIRIVGISDGYDSKHSGRKIMRGVRGLINELYLDDLRHKTHRGQAGQVERGYVAGGKSYGFDLVKEAGGSKYQINAEQAKWVVHIFERFAAGASVRSIANDLNVRQIVSPRASSWTVSAIYGSPRKGSGILNNPMYAGKYIWNRSQWVKDPDTGNRQRTERPRSEWQESDLPELRIVPAHLWEAVRARIDEGRDEEGRKRQVRPTSTLFGGILACPHCGSPMVAVNERAYGCNSHKDRGDSVCTGYYIRRDLVEKRMLAMVREELLSPVAAAEFEKIFTKMLQERLAEDGTSLVAIRARVAELDQEIGRLVDAVASIGLSDALSKRLVKAEKERADLRSRQASEPDIPNVSGLFDRLLLNLSEALKKDSAAAHMLLKSIFGRVEIELKGEEVWARMATAQLLSLAAGQSIPVVAGAGFVRYLPFRLK